MCDLLSDEKVSPAAGEGSSEYRTISGAGLLSQDTCLFPQAGTGQIDIAITRLHSLLFYVPNHIQATSSFSFHCYHGVASAAIHLVSQSSEHSSLIHLGTCFTSARSCPIFENGADDSGSQISA